MRTVNVRLMLLLIVCSVGAAGAVHAVHEYQIEGHAAAFLREAERARQRSEPGTAVRFLQRYLKVAPRDTEALAELGKLRAEMGRLNRAFRTFEQVLRRDPGRTEVRRELVAIALQLGRFADAEAHVERLLADTPDDGRLHFWRGRARLGLARQGRAEYESAARSFLQALQAGSRPDPETNAPGWVLETYADLAGLLLHQRETLRDSNIEPPSPANENAAFPEISDPKDPQAWLGRMVETHADTPIAWQAYLLRARFRKDELAAVLRERVRRGSGDVSRQAVKEVLGKALEDARRAVELAPEEGGVLLVAAQCALADGRLDEARRYARRGVKLFPRQPRMYSTLADIALKKKKPERAATWLQKGLQAVPEPQNLRWNLANLLIDHDRLDAAETEIAQLRTADSEATRVDYLEARLLVERGQWREAANRLARLRPALEEWPDLVKRVDVWLGRCYEQLGKAEQQRVAYRRAAETDPFWIPARRGLASALLSSGKLDAALEEYRQIARMPGAPSSVLFEMARLMIRSNLKKAPNERANEEIWRPVRAVLNRAEQLEPQSPSVRILRAEMLLAQGRADDAEACLLAAREKHPDEVRLWLALARLAQRQRDWDKAEELLDRAEERLGDRASLRLARGRFLVQRFGRDAADDLRALAEPSRQWSEQDRLALADGLAGLSLSVGDFDQAEKLARRVAAAQPDNLQIRLLLFDLAFRARRISALESILKELRRIEGQGPIWRYGEAVRLSLLAREQQPGSEKLFRRAQEHLAEARLARPDWARPALLSARISDRQGRPEEAIESYLKAIELGVREPEAIARTVRLLFERRRFAEADRVIRRLQQQRTPFSGDLARMAAGISLRLDDLDRALKLARATAAQSGNYRDHIWLGQLLSLDPQHHEAAETRFRQAIQLADGAPDPWVALIQFYGRTNRIEKAEAAITEAKRQINPREAPLAIAQCWESIGRTAEAEEAYRAALENRPDSGEVAAAVAQFFLQQGRVREARTHLQRMIAGEVDVEPGHLAWARRNLALVLAASGGRENIRRAQSLVQKNLNGPNPSAADRRIQAVVLGVQKGRKPRQEAIRILNDLIADERSSSPEDEYMLARLYLAENDWPRARKHLVNLVAEHPDEPRYLRTFVAVLIDRGQTGEAEPWLGRLEELLPEVFSTAKLRADALVADRRYDAAREHLREFADSVADAASDPNHRLRVAGLLEQYGRQLQDSENPAVAEPFFVEAENLYRRDADERPGDALALAAFLGRRQRADEALTILETHWQKAEVNDIAVVCSSIMTGAEEQPETLQKVARLLETAVDEHGPLPRLLHPLADVHSWRGHVSQAEELYGILLERNGRDVIALNNLAVLLALGSQRGNEALALINRAIEIADPKPTLLDSRAMVHLARKAPRRALSDLQRALEQSERPEYYFHQAQAHRALGQKDRAEQAMARALQLGLTEAGLHPLERPALRSLQVALNTR